jgi:hypothetical protein
MKIKIVNNKNEKINGQSILGKEEDDDIKMGEKKEIIVEMKQVKEMIERTILSYHNYKVVDILTSNDITISIQYLEKIYQNIEVIESDVYSKSILDIVEEVNLIKNELSSIFRNYGTQNINDLLEVTFGKGYIKTLALANEGGGVQWLSLIHI